MSRGRISVVVAGDDTGSRAALLRALEAEGDITVVAQLGSALAPRAARSLRPDLVAVDVAGSSTAVENGLSVIDQVMAHSPVPILVLHPREGAGGRITQKWQLDGPPNILQRVQQWLIEHLM